MLEGLEISELMFSEVQKNNESLRLDSQYFFKEYFHLLEFLSDKPNDRLKNVTSWVTQGPNPTFCEYDKSAIPCLTGRNINKGRVTYIDADYVDIAEYASLKKYQIKPGDTLVTLKGLGSIGKIGYVTDKREAIFSRDVGIIRPRGIDQAYLNAFILSKYGQKFVARGETGGTGQRTLTTSYLKGILVPRFSIEKRIGNFVSLSEEVLKKSLNDYKQAETLLLEALDLADLTPSTNNTNTKSFRESFGASGRLDAEYYQPKFDEIEALIRTNSLYYKRVEEIQTYNARGMTAIYDEAGTIDMITQKHILDTGLDYDNFDKTDISHFLDDEAAFVAENDILIYGTGANIGRTQPYLREQKAVACQDIIILRVTEDPVYVAFVLNSFIGRLQTDKMKTGSAQPHLYPKDIAQFLIPFVDRETQKEIREKIISSLALKKQSTTLLDIAKRAVEIAIEQDEQAALAFIAEGVATND